MNTRTWIDTRDKPGLLHAMMKEFSNNGTISFEGNLSNLSFRSLPNASTDETEILKRATLSPKLDFILIPLTDETVSKISKELSEKDHLVHEGITHVQIESGGKMAFGGYDNFHKECVMVYDSVPKQLLESLIQNGVIRSYKNAEA